MRDQTNALSAVSRPDHEALFEAFASLDTAGEAAQFLRDLATPAEIDAFAERWRIARMLTGERASYRAIAAETGASTTTVGRVARFLKNESHGGYRLLLTKLGLSTKEFRK